MKRTTGLFLAAVAVLGGCATTAPYTAPALLDGAEAVVVSADSPGAGYKAIGPASGMDGRGCGLNGIQGTYEGATIDLMNKAYAAGGDYAQMVSLIEPHSGYNCFINLYTIRATVYKRVQQ